jgi:hypothetical protein
MSRRLSHILDLFAEDSQLNVYAGELEVRPPGAPTFEWETAAFGRRRIFGALSFGLRHCRREERCWRAFSGLICRNNRQLAQNRADPIRRLTAPPRLCDSPTAGYGSRTQALE